MQVRNWLDLSRKLVDRVDLKESFAYIAAALGSEALTKGGFGIFSSKAYPSSLFCTPSGANMNVAVAAGQAYDPNGQLITVDPGASIALIADGTNPRKSLLVLRYKQTGSTPVPKPSDPILTVDLNLVDDYDLVLLSGTPSGAPVYPATSPGDVVLRGFTIPAGTTVASSATVDYSVANYVQLLNSSWDAITGYTDPTLKDALARLGAGPKRILIGVSETLAATVNIADDDVELSFQPGKSFTDGGASTGLNITGKRARIQNGRWVNFATTALSFSSAAKYGVVLTNFFNNCTDEVTDASGGTVQVVNPITE